MVFAQVALGEGALLQAAAASSSGGVPWFGGGPDRSWLPDFRVRSAGGRLDGRASPTGTGRLIGLIEIEGDYQGRRGHCALPS